MTLDPNVNKSWVFKWRVDREAHSLLIGKKYLQCFYSYAVPISVSLSFSMIQVQECVEKDDLRWWNFTFDNFGDNFCSDHTFLAFSFKFLGLFVFCLEVLFYFTFNVFFVLKFSCRLEKVSWSWVVPCKRLLECNWGSKSKSEYQIMFSGELQRNTLKKEFLSQVIGYKKLVTAI